MPRAVREYLATLDDAAFGAATDARPKCISCSYKADANPTAGDQVTFEQVLIEAGVPADKRARLLAEAD